MCLRKANILLPPWLTKSHYQPIDSLLATICGRTLPVQTSADGSGNTSGSGIQFSFLSPTRIAASPTHYQHILNTGNDCNEADISFIRLEVFKVGHMQKKILLKSEQYRF